MLLKSLFLISIFVFLSCSNHEKNETPKSDVDEKMEKVLLEFNNHFLNIPIGGKIVQFDSIKIVTPKFHPKVLSEIKNENNLYFQLIGKENSIFIKVSLSEWFFSIMHEYLGCQYPNLDVYYPFNIELLKPYFPKDYVIETYVEDDAPSRVITYKKNLYKHWTLDSIHKISENFIEINNISFTEDSMSLDYNSSINYSLEGYLINTTDDRFNFFTIYCGEEILFLYNMNTKHEGFYFFSPAPLDL
jgi:hypothetical protein